MTLTIMSFALYMVVMFAIGLYFYFRTDTLSDFVIGGRKLGTFPSAISSVASDFSGWLLMGLPGFALSGGMGAFWIALGLLIGTYCNWRFIAPKLRSESEALGDSVTIPVFLERKLNDNTGLVRIILSIAILFFFVSYTSSGLIAGGKLFSATFNVDYQVAVFIGFAVILSYTFLGGYMAVCWTDVIQGCLMLAALLVIPIMAMNSLGGFSEANAALMQQSPDHFSFFKNPDGTDLGIITILSLMAWGLGYFGQPHILSRFMGIASAKDTANARRIAVTWTFVAMSMALVTGYLGKVYFAENPLADPEQVFLALIGALTHPLVGGLLLAAVMAAIMSTADSQLLVASSAVTNDFFPEMADDPQKQKFALWVGRISVFVIAIIALLISLNPDTSLLNIVGYAWAGLGATVGSVLLLTLTWGKVTNWGAIAGIVVGGGVTIIWHSMEGGIFDIYELLPAFIAAAAAIVVVSSMTANTQASAS